MIMTHLHVRNEAKFTYISGFKQNQIRNWCRFITLPLISEM